MPSHHQHRRFLHRLEYRERRLLTSVKVIVSSFRLLALVAVAAVPTVYQFQRQRQRQLVLRPLDQMRPPFATVATAALLAAEVETAAAAQWRSLCGAGAAVLRVLLPLMHLRHQHLLHQLVF